MNNNSISLDERWQEVEQRSSFQKTLSSQIKIKDKTTHTSQKRSGSIKKSVNNNSISLDERWQEVEKYYSFQQTLSSQIEIKDQTTQTSQKGSLSIEKSATANNTISFHWTTSDHQIISDGITLWFYSFPFDVDEKGQWFEQPIKDIFFSEWILLLSCSFSQIKKMNFTEEKKQDQLILSVTPHEKEKKAFVYQKIQLIRYSQHPYLKSIILIDSTGASKEIIFLNWDFKKKFSPDLFSFHPPKGAEKMSPPAQGFF